MPRKAISELIGQIRNTVLEENRTRLAYDVVPTLPAELAETITCFQSFADPGGFFCIEPSGLRNVTDTPITVLADRIDDLVRHGVVDLACESRGPIPQTYRITYGPSRLAYQEPPELKFPPRKEPKRSSPLTAAAIRRQLNETLAELGDWETG